MDKSVIVSEATHKAIVRLANTLALEYGRSVSYKEAVDTAVYESLKSRFVAEPGKEGKE